MRRFACVFFIMLCIFQISFSENIFAFGNNGSISGTVKDFKSGEAIIGATLSIQGTSVVGVSDLDGNFSLPHVPEGKKVLVCKCLSYKEIHKEVEVKSGSNVSTVLLMEEDGVLLQEVMVAVRRRNDTEMALLESMKAQVQVTSGISSQQIAKTLDRDASEVVKRVPGISIIEDRFVVVRGLPQRYNNVWINGTAAPSLEADSRAFSFDILPSSQIDNMMIYKSPAPEIPGDFAGGFIKISTKSLPVKNSIQLGYTTGFNTVTHFDKIYLNPGSATDWLGFDASKRALSPDMPSYFDLSGEKAETITRLTRTAFNKDWRVKHFWPMPDQRLSLNINRRFETSGGTEIGNVSFINYSNTYKAVKNITNARFGVYSAVADEPVYLDNYIDNQYSNDVRVGIMHNWTFVLDNHNKLEFRNLFNLLGRNRLTERAGIKDISSPYYREQTEMMYQSRLTYVGQFAGTHFIDKKKEHSLDWIVGYSYADKNEPDRRIITNQAGTSEGADLTGIITGNENIKRYFQKFRDHVVSGGIDYKGTLQNISFRPVVKGGVCGEYRDRDYSPREFIYCYDNLTQEERNVYLYLPYNEMIQDTWLGADKVYIEEITKKTDAYQASNIYGAGYAAVEIPVRRFNIYAGLRAEYNRLRLTRDKSLSASQTLMTSRDYNNFDLLPSVNISYNINNKQLFRVAYGRSLNRPEFREVSPAVYYDFDLFNEIGGNEELKTCRVNNLDLRYEFYPHTGEIVSIGLFYKDFSDPIEWTFIDMGGTLRYSYENALSAHSLGVELDIRKGLDFIGLKGLSLLFNATFINSKVKFDDSGIIKKENRQMQGQSPYIVNAGLYYQNDDWKLMSSLIYNRLGKRIIGIGKSNSTTHDVSVNIPDTYEMPRNSLDFTVSKKFGKIFEMKAGIKDILAEKVVYKQFPEFRDVQGEKQKREQIIKLYTPGRMVSVGAVLNF